MNRSRMKFRYILTKKKEDRLRDINFKFVNPFKYEKSVRHIYNPSVHFKYEFQINLANYMYLFRSGKMLFNGWYNLNI